MAQKQHITIINMNRELKGFLITLGIFLFVILLGWTSTNWPEMMIKVLSVFSFAICFWMMYRFVMVFISRGKNDKPEKEDDHIRKKW